jgi:alkyldihydroxyacetonephosphate synthase
MKWYGWGAEGVAFDTGDRPHIVDYARTHLGLDTGLPPIHPVPPGSIRLLPPRLTVPAWEALAAALPAGALSAGRHDRLCHACGRSTRDIWRLRHGLIEWTPDAVAFPASEDEILALVAAARAHDLALIPFGGGSNVAGCLEPFAPAVRPVISVDLRRLNRVIAVDALSGTVRVQAGILGPDLERELAAHGFTLGHFPDSFLHSTLGGWVATRSSGMFSDRYGNAEDMVLALRMVTPAGIVETRGIPHTSSGPEVGRVAIGSEGALGIITELTMTVRRLAEGQRYQAYLFRDMERGIEAIRQCRAAGLVPASTRLNDPAKTQLSAAFRKVKPLDRLTGPLAKAWLRRRHRLDLSQACLMVSAFEGDADQVAWLRRRVEAIYSAHGAVAAGEGPGKAMMAGKFDLPLVRDFLFERGAITDTAETSIVWSRVPQLYVSSRAVLSEMLGRGGRDFWVGCHVSHTYSAGCSLYFTFAFGCRRDADGRYDPEAELAHYLAAKQAIIGHFVDQGGAASHHHAVGYEHLPWQAADGSLAGATIVEAAKAILDPDGRMNPGRHAHGFSLDDLRRGPHGGGA